MPGNGKGYGGGPGGGGDGGSGGRGGGIGSAGNGGPGGGGCAGAGLYACARWRFLVVRVLRLLKLKFFASMGGALTKFWGLRGRQVFRRVQEK